MEKVSQLKIHSDPRITALASELRDVIDSRVRGTGVTYMAVIGVLQRLAHELNAELDNIDPDNAA